MAPPQKNSMAFICEFGNCRKKWKALGILFHTPIRGVTFKSKGALLEIFQGSDDDRVLIDENVNFLLIVYNFHPIQEDMQVCSGNIEPVLTPTTKPHID